MLKRLHCNAGNLSEYDIKPLLQARTVRVRHHVPVDCGRAHLVAAEVDACRGKRVPAVVRGGDLVAAPRQCYGHDAGTAAYVQDFQWPPLQRLQNVQTLRPTGPAVVHHPVEVQQESSHQPCPKPNRLDLGARVVGPPGNVRAGDLHTTSGAHVELSDPINLWTAHVR
eukprot:CAMPEP_0175194168 /NCGR_PEP_ID=MMETSP0093-20121207/6352_1 /TAXON_ID=311494 /ORGANISM="Alexandrium monilatum, Strain CCMP3105" /LENGTH=167 /DNA_ID=CAMNT_0016487081 /DNA_START=286 /DNA_END=789 /DNA_ORIENTATION=+